MKLQPDSLTGVNSIRRIEAARIWVGGTPFAHSLLVPWRGEVAAWPVARFEALSAEHFAQAAGFAPEVLIFGSGARLRFAPPAVLRALIERNIGVECMDNAAAARTYNVLATEGRRVLGAFLIDATADGSG